MRPHLPITTKSKHIFLLGALFTAIAIILAILIITGTHIFQRTSALKYVTSSGSDESSALESKLGTMLGSNPAPLPSPTIMLSPPPGRYVIPQQTHVYQTFNNCGPASLSMLLSYRGTHISQKELGDILRPRQHPQGIDDDKSVTIPELAQEAKNRGLAAYHRPGATLDLVKTLIASDFPLLIRTWLKEGEDIGHY